MKKIGFLNPRALLAFLALFSISFSTYLALGFANQPPLDAHSFRQTQTALSTYWFFHDGFKLAYDTPVAGVPWSIPFEFPLYQFIVAGGARVFEISLDTSGRLTSYLFLLLCLVPARSITKSLQLPEPIFFIFSVLLFSAPIYI
ncbi:MAG: hypothetical protein ABL925_11300, partial [Methylococcales bacterium]